MNRALLGAGALALALTLTAGACSDARPDAANVNGTVIERRAFEDELRSYADNTVWTSQQQNPVDGEASGTVTMAFTNQLLRRKILLEMIRQENQRRGLTVTPEVQQQADAGAAEFTLQISEPLLTQAWDAFPESFRKQSIDETAQYLTLVRGLGGGTLDDAALRKLYDENPAKFGLLCARHILIPTEAAAKELKAQLDAGADFATLAQANSTDGSASDGGRLYTEGEDCPPSATFVPAFVDGAFSVPTGQVSAPVQTDFGWHLILVDKATELPFDQAKSIVQKFAGDKAAAELARVLQDGAKGDISVNARYGTWDPASARILAPGATPTTTTVPG